MRQMHIEDLPSTCAVPRPVELRRVLGQVIRYLGIRDSCLFKLDL
jgi:hypothetical protein